MYEAVLQSAKKCIAFTPRISALRCLQLLQNSMKDQKCSSEVFVYRLLISVAQSFTGEPTHILENASAKPLAHQSSLQDLSSTVLSLTGN